VSSTVVRVSSVKLWSVPLTRSETAIICGAGESGTVAGDAVALLNGRCAEPQAAMLTDARATPACTTERRDSRQPGMSSVAEM
jgi:hypothetical protein